MGVDKLSAKVLARACVVHPSHQRDTRRVANVAARACHVEPYYGAHPGRFVLNSWARCLALVIAVARLAAQPPER